MEGGVTVLLGGFVHKLGGDQVEVGVHWEMPEGGFPENFPCLGATGWSIPPQCQGTPTGIPKALTRVQPLSWHPFALAEVILSEDGGGP